MTKNGKLTYISLFSCAGVGCFGFKEEGYSCIATNELIGRRLNVQKINNKCEYESGYIEGDISSEETKNKIYNEIERWKKKGNDRVDVVLASPPCQGISVINHKKNDSDINRNSLVVESVEIINKIKPRFFIFENVMAFEKTLCITSENKVIKIGDFIREQLGTEYIISSKILNFMNYGANSSRTRTIIIGVDNKYKNHISPLELFPDFVKEKTLRDVIYNLPRLAWDEIDATDFYHAFRVYNPEMRNWIHDLRENESAFDNEDPLRRPHRVVNGEVVQNVKKSRDKYTRQPWDRFIQCVHTRNDQLAAQNTIHPEDDRVFSIRELMLFMNIPNSFKWVDKNLDELNRLSLDEKKKLYKLNEVNIRQCIGEAIPTIIIKQIAHKIKEVLSYNYFDSSNIKKIIAQNNLYEENALCDFIETNPINADISTLMRIVELCNSKRDENAAFYTNKFIVNMIFNRLPDFSKDEIHILEPSVGAGSFIPFILKKYSNCPKVIIDVVDIDEKTVNLFRILITKLTVPDNITINIHCANFLDIVFPYTFDLIVGNPPFSKTTKEKAKLFKNKNTNNLSALFLEKCLEISDYTSLVLNKTILANEEFKITRDLLRSKKIESIIDFGRYGFTGVSIETCNLIVNTKQKPLNTEVENLKHNFIVPQDQKYITDPNYPCFLIYRNSDFDIVADKLQFDIFKVFRDRQITKKCVSESENCDSTWVLKAKNIKDDGTGINHINGYDVYIDNEMLKTLSVNEYKDNLSVFLTPNMTYNTRVIRNPGNIIFDGSVAVLIPKNEISISDKQLLYFSTEEYRKFYIVARNLSTQSINVDNTSVFFYGILKDDN